MWVSVAKNIVKPVTLLNIFENKPMLWKRQNCNVRELWKILIPFLQHYCKLSRITNYRLGVLIFMYVKRLLSVFIKLVVFTRKWCCLHRPMGFLFAFSDYLFFGGGVPLSFNWWFRNLNSISVNIIFKILYIINKVVVWIDLDIRCEQAENLMG